MVTGASAGIGRACARALALAGYSVVLTGRRKALLDEVAAEIAGNQGEALAFAADIADPQSVIRLFDETKRVFGRLDLLFNNAGAAAPPIDLELLAFEQWKNVVDVNLT